MSGILEGRIALITGASRGIGAAVAKRLAREGAHTILLARTVGGLEEVDDAIQAMGGQATLVPLDLTKADQIDALGAEIFQRFKRLDILVGNAGILGSLTPVSHIVPKVWDEVIATNLTANYRLLRSMDPLLKASASGRAMFVTSNVTEAVYPYWGAYAASKLALACLGKTYAAENKHTSVKANLINPGEVRTDMHAAAMPGQDPMKLVHPDEITDIFVELAAEACTASGKKFHV
ncbi:MAG: SDR family NAD(P)-dependent oxidoreductase [Alphaproteobacteria bacterium]|nr:SDR family NAD(P)-dependent oxidoreductase [Alphaproteobacteria bacterium]